MFTCFLLVYAHAQKLFSVGKVFANCRKSKLKLAHSSFMASEQ